MGDVRRPTVLDELNVEQLRSLSDLERVEELMGAYGRSYDELVAQPYTRFEDLWQAYSIRTNLDRLDEEVARQRSTLMGAFAEPQEVERELQALEERAAEARRIIMDPDSLTRDKGTEVIEGLRTDKWWESPRGPDGPVEEEGGHEADEATPVARTARLEEVLEGVEIVPGRNDLPIEVEIEE